MPLVKPLLIFLLLSPLVGLAMPGSMSGNIEYVGGSGSIPSWVVWLFLLSWGVAIGSKLFRIGPWDDATWGEVFQTGGWFLMLLAMATQIAVIAAIGIPAILLFKIIMGAGSGQAKSPVSLPRTLETQAGNENDVRNGDGCDGSNPSLAIQDGSYPRIGPDAERRRRERLLLKKL